MHSNRFSIIYSDRIYFIVSLEVKKEEKNIKITIGIENQMNHQL
jgi:hypothetical protein